MTTIDEAAITGESMPVSKGLEEVVFAGTVNLNGSITVEITKLSNETLFQKVIHLDNSLKPKSHLHSFLLSVSKAIYVKFGISSGSSHDVCSSLFTWLELDRVFLSSNGFTRSRIAMCACRGDYASNFIRQFQTAPSTGILFKGGIHLENLSHIHAIAFDKTGTLTKGQPRSNRCRCKKWFG